MRTHAHHFRLGVRYSNNLQKALAAGLVLPFFGKVRREPNAAFHGDGFFHSDSHYFDIPEESWYKAMEAIVPAKFLEMNKKAFELGKDAQ